MRRPERTLISRIVWTTALISALAMAAMIGTVLLVLSALTKNNIDARLSDQFTAISSTIAVEDDSTVTALETPDDGIDDTTWIFDTDGALLEGPRAGKGVNEVVASLADVRRRTQVNRLEHEFLAAPVRIDGKLRAVVVVGASLEPYEGTRTAVLIGLIGLGATVTAGSAAVAAWNVRRTLAPVETMASRADDWSEHNLDARFEPTGADDEFARLGRTLNVLLDRVAGALRNEQQLTSELAHELRTPLTAIRGEAELAAMADLTPEETARQQRIVELVDHMSDTITSLLDIARGRHRPDARTTTADVVSSATSQGLELAHLMVDTSGVNQIDIQAPLDLAVRTLSPLIANAAQHAHSTIRISTDLVGRTIEIHVSDDGPGIATTDPESLFKSGQRDTSSAGAGLGLALSRRVARTLGGDVSITSMGDPTTFTVSLPQF